MEAGAPSSICFARVEDEANDATTLTPVSLLNRAAISFIAFVVDAAAKIINCVLSAAKQLIAETSETPIRRRIDKIEISRFFRFIVVLSLCESHFSSSAELLGRLEHR